VQHAGGFRSQERVFIATQKAGARKREEDARAAELKQVARVCTAAPPARRRVMQ
jgi:hypothetical protein